MTKPTRTPRDRLAASIDPDAVSVAEIEAAYNAGCINHREASRIASLEEERTLCGWRDVPMTAEATDALSTLRAKVRN